MSLSGRDAPAAQTLLDCARQKDWLLERDGMACLIDSLDADRPPRNSLRDPRRHATVHDRRIGAPDNSGGTLQACQQTPDIFKMPAWGKQIPDFPVSGHCPSDLL